MKPYLILGAGLSGLSASYHLGHKNCLILESSRKKFGHISSEVVNGFRWDQGPHVSFTKSVYVQQLFADSVKDEYYEHDVTTKNYYNGVWLDHPLQTSLYQLESNLRTACLTSFLETRNEHPAEPQNYEDWLNQAFGPKFAETFPSAYTRKYWTYEPRQLSTDWVGSRVYRPDIEEVIQGSKGVLDRKTHYITKIRYPKFGGYQSFGEKLGLGANVIFDRKVAKISLRDKIVFCSDGSQYAYKTLINTLPLDKFVQMTIESPIDVVEAADNLDCSQLLLVNVVAKHKPLRTENWQYVYDLEKYSTRINHTDLLSPNNGIPGKTGIQVEVYFSKNRPFVPGATSEIAQCVLKELVEMGLIENLDSIESFSTQFVPYANVIFKKETSINMEIILSHLSKFGLEREPDDLYALTNWSEKNISKLGDIILAGRFGQWKYYWSDDCVLRGKVFSSGIKN
jgi:protoporphyrinogen oxidase